MRTGIIHLTGLAATLLFSLTIIAWVDSHWHTAAFGFRDVTGQVQVWSHDGQFGVLSQRADLTGYPDSWFGRWDRNDDAPSVIDPITTRGWGPLRYCWKKEWGGVGTFSGFNLPHWLAASLFSIPALMYLRFLRRRKRQPPVDDDTRTEPAA